MIGDGGNSRFNKFNLHYVLYSSDILIVIS